MGERKLEYKDSKGQDCYFYYSNIAGTELDMPFYVCNAECVSGMKKRESKSETFRTAPFEYEFLYAPLGDSGAYMVERYRRDYDEYPRLRESVVTLRDIADSI